VHQAQLLLAAGNPEAEAPPEWRRVSSSRIRHQKPACGPDSSLANSRICRSIRKCRGRVLTAEDIARLREFIAEQPGLSRRKLSAGVCEAAVEACQWSLVRHGLPRRHMMVSSMAGNYGRRPWFGDIPKWPQNGPLRGQNRMTFSASEGSGRNVSCRSRCPRIHQRLADAVYCRTERCGTDPAAAVERRRGDPRLTRAFR